MVLKMKAMIEYMKIFEIFIYASHVCCDCYVMFNTNKLLVSLFDILLTIKFKLCTFKIGFKNSLYSKKV